LTFLLVKVAQKPSNRHFPSYIMFINLVLVGGLIRYDVEEESLHKFCGIWHDMFLDSSHSFHVVIQQPRFHSLLFVLSYWQCRKISKEPLVMYALPTFFFVRDCTCPLPLFLWCDITNSNAVQTSYEMTVLHSWAVCQEVLRT
jgi:hypothetical protein